jgi:hypothetical protein
VTQDPEQPIKVQLQPGQEQAEGTKLPQTARGEGEGKRGL